MPRWPGHLALRLLLPLLTLPQAVQGCGGSCATLWYFWFGIFLALMIGFILLIVGVNFCLKRQRDNKLVIRHFRINPQSDTSSEDTGLPREATMESRDVEGGRGREEQPDSTSHTDSTSRSPSPSVVSDVESLPDTQGLPATPSHFRSISPRHFAFASPTQGATRETSLPRDGAKAGGHSSRSEEAGAGRVAYEGASEHRHSVSGMPLTSRPLSPSSSLDATGELSRTLNLSSSGPVLVVDTPRSGVTDSTS